jgi:hypothetical protein
VTTETDQLYRGIKLLDQAVAGGHWDKAKNWEGASVVIRRRMPKRKHDASTLIPALVGGGSTGYKYVITPHAAQLSWLFADLWQVFRQHPAIDGMTKFEFFGRLANASLHCQRRANGNESARDLLGAVIHEAYAIADEIEEGTFTALPVAPVGIVFDDLIERFDREAYLTVEETRRWFAERGIE